MTEPLVVLICGGRDNNRMPELELAMLYFEGQKPTRIVHGGAKGADQLAQEWAEKHGIETKVYPADWEKHGKKAGPIRNQEMLDNEDIDYVVALTGGKGTADMVRRAHKAGVGVIEIDVEYE